MRRPNTSALKRDREFNTSQAHEPTHCHQHALSHNRQPRDRPANASLHRPPAIPIKMSALGARGLTRPLPRSTKGAPQRPVSSSHVARSTSAGARQQQHQIAGIATGQIGHPSHGVARCATFGTRRRRRPQRCFGVLAFRAPVSASSLSICNSEFCFGRPPDHHLSLHLPDLCAQAAATTARRPSWTC